VVIWVSNQKGAKAEPMAVAKKLILIFVFLALLSSCQQDISKELILLDFESDAELDQLYWSCHTLYSLSNDHVTHGSKSLMLELFPSDYPGMIYAPAKKNWSDYQNLSFDIYNPSKESVQIVVRIDDRKDYPNYGDRYSKSHIIKKGSNHINIPLETLVVSGSNRRLNLTQIQRMFIFMRHPEIETILYVDAIKIKR
jgi:hypothetical protein